MVVILGVTLLLSMVPSAFAWEFDLRGDFEYRFRYFSRTGSKDLFGLAPLQEGFTQNSILPAYGAAIGFAGPNYYNSGASRPPAESNAENANTRITRGGFSRYGCDAKVPDMRMRFYPTIRVNEAIETYLVLNVGGFRNKYSMNKTDSDAIFGVDPYPAGPTATQNFYMNKSAGIPPFENYYMSQTSDSAYNTASIISVEQFKVAFHLPWGVFSFGTKNFPIGTGATYAKNTREEAVYFLVPYGPFSFRTYLFPGEPPRLGGASGPTATTTDAWSYIWSGWGTGADGETKAQRSLGEVVEYQSGNMEFGIGAFNRKFHLPKGYWRGYWSWDLVNFIPELAWAAVDMESWTGVSWVKYNNGRFFFNLEYAFSNAEWQWTNFTTSSSPGQFWLYLVEPKYEVLSNHWFAEMGVLSGPSKVALMAARSSGRVLSNVDKSATYGRRANPTKWYEPFPINYQAMEPYNYLMFYTYAGGNNIFNLDGNGEMGDAYALALRADYAIAANFNIWASYMRGYRLERHGYYAGAFGNYDDWTGSGAGGNQTAAAARTWKLINGYSFANPWIDENFIGWEANVGADWKLLEGLRVTARYAYWQPGGWFDLAYKAFTPTATGRVGDGVQNGRDAIHAFTTSLFVEF